MYRFIELISFELYFRNLLSLIIRKNSSMILRNRLTIYLLFVILLPFSSAIVSCGGDNDTTDTTTDVIVFKGIRVTDTNGKVYENDLSDWTLTEAWTDKENSLFVEKKVNLCDTSNSIYGISSYPNPCNGNFNLHISKPIETRFAFRIVDRNFNVLLSQDSVFSNGIAFDLNYLNIRNDTVRIYYKFLGQDCELKGHGDILIN